MVNAMYWRVVSEDSVGRMHGMRYVEGDVPVLRSV